MTKVGHIIQCFLNPEPMFGDTYPLDFEDVVIYEYSTLTEEELKEDHIMSYEWKSSTRSDKTLDYVKKVSNLEEYWEKTKDSRFGLEGNVDAVQMNFRYFDPSLPCANVIVSYPPSDTCTGKNCD